MKTISIHDLNTFLRHILRYRFTHAPLFRDVQKHKEEGMPCYFTVTGYQRFRKIYYLRIPMQIKILRLQVDATHTNAYWVFEGEVLESKILHFSSHQIIQGGINEYRGGMFILPNKRAQLLRP